LGLRHATSRTARCGQAQSVRDCSSHSRRQRDAPLRIGWPRRQPVHASLPVQRGPGPLRSVADQESVPRDRVSTPVDLYVPTRSREHAVAGAPVPGAGKVERRRGARAMPPARQQAQHGVHGPALPMSAVLESCDERLAAFFRTSLCRSFTARQVRDLPCDVQIEIRCRSRSPGMPRAVESLYAW
jgi:hypothetical protein